jgi:hypothetical protein
MKKIILAAALMVAASTAMAKVVAANWKPCATGVQHDEPSFDEFPAWANTKALRPYYDSDPRLLSNHGLCNAKFHRVVLCLPGWEENVTATDPAPWTIGRAAASDVKAFRFGRSSRKRQLSRRPAKPTSPRTPFWV